MEFVRTCSVDIAAPADVVYPLVADLTQHPRWVYNKLTMEHVSGSGIGAKYRSEVREVIPGSKKPIPGDISVVEDSPPRRFVFEAEDAAGRYRWTYAFAEADGKTHVDQTCVRLKGPFPIPLIQPMLWAAAGRKQVQGGLEKLKAVAEMESLVPKQEAMIELPAEERQT
jgi:uncharacterized protein YndB with AHSA1/START domain